VRIGLFTEQNSNARGLQATVDALIAHCPKDAVIIQYSRPGLKALLGTHELVSRAAADRIDVVHVTASGPMAAVALLAAGCLRLPVIGSFQLQPPSTSGVAKAYLRGVIRHTRRLLLASMAARTTLIGTGVDPSKIALWRPGVDCLMFSPSKRSDALRGRWGVSDTQPAVIFAGALSDERGARRLISMEVALHRTHPMHQLIVIGDGPKREEMQARCPNALFTGALHHAAMPEVLASADLFVCPSDAISTNLAVLEAQASGLPVVVMEGGSARERVTDMTARVCRSHADFIVETATLVRTTTRRAAMGLAARKYAKQQDWAAGLAQIYAEYRTAAESSRARRRDVEPSIVAQSGGL
jgi:glycosyltransferase involved in cell wall biosynthesis